MQSQAQFFYRILDQIKSFFLLLYSNFVGSETQNPYSEAYIWMANQFGHFFVGFGGLFLVTWIASYYFRRPAPSYSYGGRLVDPSGRPTLESRTVWLLAAIWLAVWMAKKWLFDYLRGSYIGWIYVDPFNDDLLLDTATDSFFYIAGITVALAHFGKLGLAPIPVLLGVLVIAIGLGSYWLPAREKLETVGTPFFIRLSGVAPGVSIGDLDKQEILDNLMANDPAPQIGLRSAIQPAEYPFQYLMDPQEERRQILSVGNNVFISRFFMAIANERVIRQPVKMPCDTRYVTFRDLLNSEIVNAASVGSEPDWEMRTPSGQYSGINGPACAIENAELLIVDQVPAIENVASMIISLMHIPDPTTPLPATAPEAEPASTGTVPDASAAAARLPGQDRILEIFEKSLRKKTVIWVVDSPEFVNGLSASLKTNFPPDAVSFLNLR